MELHSISMVLYGAKTVLMTHRFIHHFLIYCWAGLVSIMAFFVSPSTLIVNSLGMCKRLRGAQPGWGSNQWHIPCHRMPYSAVKQSGEVWGESNFSEFGWVSVWSSEVVSNCLCCTCFSFYFFSLLPFLLPLLNNFYLNPFSFLL